MEPEQLRFRIPHRQGISVVRRIHGEPSEIVERPVLREVVGSWGLREAVGEARLGSRLPGAHPGHEGHPADSLRPAVRRSTRPSDEEPTRFVVPTSRIDPDEDLDHGTWDAVRRTERR